MFENRFYMSHLNWINISVDKPEYQHINAKQGITMEWSWMDYFRCTPLRILNKMFIMSAWSLLRG